MQANKLEQILENAADARIACEKIKQHGIRYVSPNDNFATDAELFEEIFINKECKIIDFKKHGHLLHYVGTIDGIEFYCLTDDLLFTDEYKEDKYV